MKRIILGGLAAALVLLGAPMAGASAHNTIHGGCFFHANEQDDVTNGAYLGVIGDRSVTTTNATPPAPVNAKVTCQIEVGTTLIGSTRHTYGDGSSPVQAGQDTISYVAPEGTVVSLCQTVEYADGETDGPTCEPAIAQQIPPQVVYDTLDGLFIGTIDPLVCPILKAHAGSYGPITIESDGDVIGPDPLDLGLNPYDDCPPYRTV